MSAEEAVKKYKLIPTKFQVLYNDSLEKATIAVDWSNGYNDPRYNPTDTIRSFPRYNYKIYGISIFKEGSIEDYKKEVSNLEKRFKKKSTTYYDDLNQIGRTFQVIKINDCISVSISFESPEYYIPSKDKIITRFMYQLNEEEIKRFLSTRHIYPD